jgi:hypothetical protein
MAKKQKNKTQNNYLLYLAIGVVSVAIAVFVVLAIIRNNQNASTGEHDNVADYNSANEILQSEEDLKDEDKVAQSSNNAKDRMEADESEKATVEQNESGLLIAEPEISFVASEDEYIVAGGSIPNINETSGVCTFVFEKGGELISQDSNILPNPSYISCENVSIPKNKFSSGVWTVTLKYKSNTSEGTSETQTITVQ